MATYLIRRLAIALIVLFGLSLLAFFLVRLVPGDTVTAMLGAHYSEADAAALREKHGLDRPLIVQYVVWLGNLVRGDLGMSLTGRAVTAEIADALPITLQLMCISLLFAMVFGAGLGVAAAMRRNRMLDYIAATIALLGLSIPGFWLGTLLILLLALKFGLLPSGGFVAFDVDPVANLRHMVMPGLALGAAVAAVIMRMTRTAMVDVLDEDYMRTARAKGAGPAVIIIKHGLKNALIPVLTILGIQAGYLLGGSVVIEEVFSLNGVGRMILRAIGDRDYQLLQGGILLVGSGFLAINLLVDVLYALLDPRIGL